MLRGAGGVLFHGAETGSHALEGVIREELELEEQEESVVDSIGWDVGLLCDTAVRTQYVLHVTSPVSLLTQTHILYITHSTHCLFTFVVNYINYNYASLPSSAVAEPEY